jgi:hypothetical protein
LAGQQLPGFVRRVKAAIDEGFDAIKEALAADDIKPRYPITPFDNAATACLIFEIDEASCSRCRQPAAPEDHSHRLVIHRDGPPTQGCGARFVSVSSRFLSESELTIERDRVMQSALPIVPYPG